MRLNRSNIALAILASPFLALASLSFARTSVFREHLEVFSDAQTLTFALSVGAMLAGYGLLVHALMKGAALSRWAWMMWGAIFFAICLATPPLLSRDAAIYAIAGESALAGVNPYLAPLSAFDAAWSMELGPIWWMGFPVTYGPLFVLFAAASMLAPTQGLLAAVFAYKAANIGIFLISVALMAKLARRLELPGWIVPAYAFNPAMLVHVALEGHNDILVVVCLLGALYLGLSGAKRSGAALLGAAAAAKFYPILLLPMLLVGRDRLREKAERLAISAAVGLASAAPFGFPFAAMLEGLRMQATLPCLYACSPFVDALAFIFGAETSVPRLAAALIIYAAAVWRFLLAPKTVDGAALAAYVFWTLAAFFFVQIRWLAPWYVAVLLPFSLLLSRRHAYLAATFLLTAFSLLQYVQGAPGL